MSCRSFEERLKKYDDSAHHKYIVSGSLAEGKPPIVCISTGADVVEIDVNDWTIVEDCVRRAIETIGDHYDAETKQS